MLRVILVTGSLSYGGAERHSIALMNRLAERGHQCHAVYIKNVGDQLDRVRLREGGTVRCLDATRYFDRRALTDFAAHISRIRPSAVVAANPYALLYGWLALRRAGVRAPLAVTFHTTLLPGVKQWLQMLYYRPFFWLADRPGFICKAEQRPRPRRRGVPRRHGIIYHS